MGYIGHKMSQRAYEAYQNGEMPKTKWKKDIILAHIEEADKNTDIKKLKKYSTETLRDYFLVQTSWHHTAKYFNETDFFSFSLPDNIDYEKLDDLEKENKAKRAAKKKNKESDIFAKVKYGEWTGTRKYPRLKEYTEYAIIRGNIAYLSDGRTKRITGKHFEILETYERSPEGHTGEFRKIMANMKKKK